MSQSPTNHQRPPAELKFAEELALLQKNDTAIKPPNWQLSMPAVKAFILGDPKNRISQKMMLPVSTIERCLVTLASQRALLLIGEPGTAKSLLSELLSSAVSGDSTLTVQGSAATSEEQIRYSWNYGLLLNQGPSLEAIVPSPIMRGMQAGKIVRFEEITRCPPEVQDGLLSILSERLLMIPELGGQNEAVKNDDKPKTKRKTATESPQTVSPNLTDNSTIFAQAGFNIIATANTRDKGVNEMSAALKRRFSFETIFAISHIQDEMQLVNNQVRQLLEQQGLAITPTPEVTEVIVTLFRELREGIKTDGKAMEKLSTTLSTAEAVSVAHAVALHGYYLRGDNGKPSDVIQAMMGAAIKDNLDDQQKLKRYLDYHIKERQGSHWQALYHARTDLQG